MRSATPLLALLVLSGCAFHAGPDGIDAVLAGSFYSHSDEQADAGEGNKDGTSRWTTHAVRTWGTSGIEGKITHNSETLSITGDGISSNLAGVLGEDVIDKIAYRVACALQPAQAGCVP